MSSPNMNGSITAPSSAYPGTSYTYTVSVPYAQVGVPLNLYYTVNGTTIAIKEKLSFPTSTFTATIPYSFLASIPTSSSAVGTLTVYYGLEKTTKSMTFRSKADASTLPTIGTVTYEDQDVPTATLGGYLQGTAKIKATVPATARYGATITSTTISFNGITQSVALPYQGNKAGTIPVTVTVKDSRGYSATKTSSFVIKPYAPPSITSIQPYRSDASAALDPSGDRVSVYVASSAWSITSGIELNKIRVFVSTKPSGTSTWGPSMEVGGTSRIYNDTLTLPGTYDVTNSYDVRVLAIDQGQSQSIGYSRVLTEAVTYDLNGTNVGIGKYWEKGALDVGGDVHAVSYKLQDGSGGLSPTGSVVAFAGSSAPMGWALCDGSTKSKTQFPELYAVIGNTYGSTSTTFTVPDMRGRTAVGLSTDVEFNALGKEFGTKTHTLTTAQMPSHGHTASTNSTGAHTHSGTAASAGAHTHGVGGSGTRYVTTDRTTTFSQRTAPTGLSGTAAIPAYGTHQDMYADASTVPSAGAHTHSITANSAGAHSHTVTINSTGSGSAHNNIQPSIALNYIIKT